MIDPTTRHVWLTAALAATMQACYGPRFVLGLGRGDDGYFRGTGIRMAAPLAMLSSLALCAHKGILVKDGRAAEKQER